MSQPVLKRYVAYQLPGVFVAEESVYQIVERNPGAEVENAPTSAFSFQYFDVISVIIRDDDGQEVETSSGRRNFSKTYLINAEVFSVDDVVMMAGEDSVLVMNMRINNWPAVVACRTGNYLPFDPERQEMISVG